MAPYSRKANLLIVFLLLLSSLILMAADAPSSDITINIEGSNNDLKVEILERLQEEDTSGMTKEELQDLVELLTKFVATKQPDSGVEVRVVTNPPAQSEGSSKSEQENVTDFSKVTDESAVGEENQTEEGSSKTKTAKLILLSVLLLLPLIMIVVFVSAVSSLTRF